MIDAWLEGIGTTIQNNFWAAPLWRWWPGSYFLQPLLPVEYPAVIGYVGYMAPTSGRPSAFAGFAAGAAVTFTLLGVMAALMGRLLGMAARWWYLLLGLLMVLMALQVWEVFQFIPSTYLTAKSKKRGYAGAFIAGILGGFFSVPCATPVLVALLAVVAGKGARPGALLLLSTPWATCADRSCRDLLRLVQKLSRSKNYARLSQALKLIMGGAILLLGFYLLYLGF